jgi:pimeloyl-ACP methyl ester carboxylesterase
MPDYADALAALIDALGLERPHVCGLSFGSSVALELERRHPGIARSLVLVGAYAGWGGSLPPEVVAQRLQKSLAEADLPHDEWLAATQSYLPGFFAGPMPQEVLAEKLAIMADARPAGIRPSVLAMAEADLREGLDRIAIPVLLLHGDLDARSLPSISEDLRRRIPGSSLVVVPGAGHVVTMEAPLAFDVEVRRFLSSVSSPSRT